VLNLLGTHHYKKADYARAEKAFEKAEKGFRIAYGELTENVVSDLQVCPFHFTGNVVVVVDPSPS